MVGQDKRQRFLSQILRALLLAALLVFIPQTALAQSNRIHSIDVDVFLDENGTGHFTEVWQVEFYDKTEIYRPMGDLGGARLYNYQVTQDGAPMTDRTPWDLDASFDQKTGHYGINETDSGFELCFGLGKYGPTSFTVTYEVEGLVMELQDYQAIYWKFINEDMNPAPERASVKVRADRPFHYETERIWGFGFEGWMDIPQEGHPDAGVITMEVDAPLGPQNAMILLARFPEGKFRTSNVHDRPFDDFIDMAFEGSSYDKDDYDPNATYEDLLMMDREAQEKEDLIFKIFMAVFGLLVFLGGLALFYDFLVNLKKRKLEKEIFPSLKTRSKELDGQYVRDIPEESVFDLYDLFEKLDVQDLEANFLTAGILYLIWKGKLQPQSLEKGLVFKREETALQIIDTPDQLEGALKKLFDMAVKSAGSDRLLTQKEFSKFVSKNISTYESYAKTLSKDSKALLRVQDYYGPAPEMPKGLEASAIKKLLRDHGAFLSPKGAQVRDDLVRFHNYLKDFSLLNERGSAEVLLWDQLMIYAAAFGITDQVEKEFEKIYPQYQMETTYSPGTIIWAQNFGHQVNRSYVSAVNARDNISSGRSSSGGGGFSSGGGGGGSFGGSSGGGGR